MAGSISVKEFARALDLEVLFDGNRQNIQFTTANVNRPGMQLCGYFDYFASDRVQIIGREEHTYLMERMQPEQRRLMLDRLMSYPIPCMIISRSQAVLPELYDAAQRHSRPLFRCTTQTTLLVGSLISYLGILLAPSITMHGVLMDVAGVGVLITGESGLGKSETALELIKRDNRLVADDAVEIARIANDQLIGSSPESTRHFMELRGIGIVDVRELYGIGAVMVSKAIDLEIKLEVWDTTKRYDRLGLVDEKTMILGVELPLITVPVRAGRNLAMVIEVAARNMRLKNMGYNSAEELHKRLNSNLDAFGEI